MTDELKDIIYSDLFRYTGNARRYKNIYACYLQERRSSPEFSYISVMRRTRYYYDQIQKYDGIRRKIAEIKLPDTNAASVDNTTSINKFNLEETNPNVV